MHACSTLRLLFLVIACTGLSACLIAPKTANPIASTAAQEQERQLQLQLVLKETTSMRVRLNEIGWNILHAGAALCKHKGYFSGLATIDQNKLDEKYLKAANIVYGLSEYPKVLGIASGSGADTSGLQVGDTIVGFDGTQLPKNKDSVRRIIKYLNSTRTDYHIEIVRLGTPHHIRWNAPQVCHYDLALKIDGSINAYADGNNIVIHSGMMDFAREDSELALVVAHELAHNMRDHIDAKIINSTGGLLLGTLLDVALGTGSSFGQLGQNIGAQSYSVGFEREADYVGLYIMARSHYPIDDAPLFWRRMGTKGGGRSIDFSTTHPNSVDRMTALQATVNEIRAKQSQGLPLIPNEN